MKSLLTFVLVLAALAGAAYGVGLVVPRESTSASATNLDTDPALAYALIQDVTRWPAWHPAIAAVRPGEAGELPTWNVTTNGGSVFELTTVTQEAPTRWEGSYELDGVTTSLRFDLEPFGSGVRLRVVTKTATEDPWLRARNLVLQPEETEPVELLNALVRELGASRSRLD